MKKTVAIVVFIVFAAVMLSACSHSVSHAEVVKEKLPSWSDSAGGYSADMYRYGGGSTTKPQFYYWEPRDINFMNNTCVTLGMYTQKITLYYSDGFHWENKGNDWCLKRN